MYAILVMVIVCAVSISLLGFFNTGSSYFDRLLQKEKSDQYSCSGINWLASDDLSFEMSYEFNYPDGLSLVTEKKRWGGYDLYLSTVIAANGDTLSSRKALIGAKKGLYDTALYIRDNEQPAYIAENVRITGKSFVPLGKFSAYGINRDQPVQAFESTEDLVPLNNAEPVLSWLNSIISDGGIFTSGKIFSSNFSSDFGNPSMIISGDTVSISCRLEGNIIILAETIVAMEGATLWNTILIAKSIYLPEGFTGSLQAFATDTIKVGKYSKIKHPSILSLLPEMNKKATRKDKIHPFLYVGESSLITAEIIAYDDRINRQKTSLIDVGSGSVVMGGIYSTGNLKMEGTCIGTIHCNKFIGTVNFNLQENLLKNININIDSLPSFYCFSNLFPVTGDKKIIATVN